MSIINKKGRSVLNARRRIGVAVVRQSLILTYDSTSFVVHFGTRWSIYCHFNDPVR